MNIVIVGPEAAMYRGARKTLANISRERIVIFFFGSNSITLSKRSLSKMFFLIFLNFQLLLDEL